MAGLPASLLTYAREDARCKRQQSGEPTQQKKEAETPKPTPNKTAPEHQNDPEGPRNCTRKPPKKTFYRKNRLNRQKGQKNHPENTRMNLEDVEDDVERIVPRERGHRPQRARETPGPPGTAGVSIALAPEKVETEKEREPDHKVSSPVSVVSS